MLDEEKCDERLCAHHREWALRVASLLHSYHSELAHRVWSLSMCDLVIACTEKGRALPFPTSNCVGNSRNRRAQEPKCIGAFFFIESNLPETELVKCFNLFRSLSVLHQQTRSKRSRIAIHFFHMYNVFEQATSTKHRGHEPTTNVIFGSYRGDPYHRT